MGEGLTFANDVEREAWKAFVAGLGDQHVRSLLERWLGGVRELAMRNASQAMTIAALRDEANAAQHQVELLRARLAAVQGQRGQP